MQNYHRKRIFTQEEAFSPFPAYICISTKNTNPHLKHARLHILLLVLLLTISSEGVAQWRKIMDFGSPVASVYFFEQPQKPTEGFIGTIAPDVWQTKDEGKMWKRITYPPNVDGLALPAKSFSFKDKKVGWFNDIGGTFRASTYYTVDGGDSWTPLSFHGANSVFYVPSTRYVVGGSNAGSYCYSTDGINFQTIGTIFSDATLNVAFSDNLHGIISPYSIYNNIYTTSDGGISWLKGELEGDLYQPVGIKNSLLFFAIREASSNSVNNGDFLRSTDGGVNWQKIYTYWNTAQYAVTGTVQYGHNMSLFFQTTSDNSEGIMMSDDSGKTFMSLCGPKNEVDTKFFVRDSFIYAGDKYGGLWLNTTGIGSNSVPILSKSNVILLAHNCSDIFDTITFTLFDSCNGRQATLLDASLNGSTKFSLNSGLVPRSIHPDDTLAIQYKPTSDLAEDTAIIQLRFKLGWKEFDTLITLIGKGYKAKDFITTSFNPDTIYSNTTICSNDSQMIHFRVQDTCRDIFATASKGNISGSSAFVLPPQLPKQSTGDDSLVVTFSPLRFGLDTSMLHVTFELDGVNVDTTFVLIGEYRPSKLSLAPSVSDTSLSVTSSNCIGASGHVYYWVFDSCLAVKGELISATVTGSTNFQVTADADSATVIYNGAGYDTAKLALKFRLYEYEYDTIITLYGYPSATKDSLSFLATLTKPSVTWEETTELRVTPDKAAANKNLSEIRFDVTLDADVLEPLTNFTTGIAGATITMSGATPVGKLSRYPFVIRGNNMTLDPAVSILRLPMRPYVSDTTMTTINVSTIHLNPQDPDYERCTLSATGGDVPFSLELMCGDSLLSRHLGGKPILTITSLKPNPTKADVTVTFDLATSGAVKAEVLDVLGNVVKEETLEATRGETKYNISLPDAAEGVYYVRLRFGSETRTGKLIVE
jgi:hypothetical protein